MSQRSSIELPATPILYASPDSISDYGSEPSPYEHFLADGIPSTPFNTASPTSTPGRIDYSDCVESFVADFHRCLGRLDAQAQANSAQGQASKSAPQFNASLFADLESEPHHPANANGFGSGKVIHHLIFTEQPAALERRILRESTFKLQPAPLWTRRPNKANNRMAVVPFKEIEVGADHCNPAGVSKYALSAPQPTAKVSSWLYAIPGTHPAFENLFEADEPLDLRFAAADSPRLEDLDSFTDVFEMKGFETDLFEFELPDPRTSALLLMRDLTAVLMRLAERI